MKHLDGYIKDSGNNNIYYQHWLPKSDPKTILLIVHGYSEHSSRYINMAKYFVSLNNGVYTLDHIGHGKSDGHRVYINNFSDFINTVKIYCDLIKTWQPKKPIYLLGHSMGGLISSALLIENQHEFSGTILTSPCIKTYDKVSLLMVILSKFLSI